jgi:MFS transporter, SP family, general alpha glucoside:H+ symporter
MADKLQPAQSVSSSPEKDVLNHEAQHAANGEKSMTLGQAIRLYPKAVGWSIVLSSALIMEGYDLALLGSLYASPQFNRKYGVRNPTSGKWSVPAPWQSAL